MITKRLEVWLSPDGHTTLLSSGTDGDNGRKLLEPGCSIIKVIYATSHFDAMTQYYKFMDFGVYETIYEQDKLPYKE